MVNLCIVNEDNPPCNVSRKTIKACPSRGQLSLSWALSSPLTLSHLESGHTDPFPPQDCCSPCVFVYCSHNSRSCRLGSASQNSEHNRCSINTSFTIQSVRRDRSAEFYILENTLDNGLEDDLSKFVYNFTLENHLLAAALGQKQCQKP